MKLKIYAIHDDKMQAFSRPLFFQNHGTAIRSFSDAIQDPKSDYARHPSDYRLYCLGEYDDNTGIIVSLSQPEYVVHAIELTNGKEK